MLKKIVLITGLVVFLLFLAGGYYGIYHVAPYAIIMPSRPPDSDSVYTLTPEHFGLRCEPFTVAVDDSIRLDAWFLPARDNVPYGTILMLHGIGGVKEHMLGGAAEMVNSGFNVVLYDSRAHGHSTGRYCTYGYYEKYDVSRVIDAVERRFGTTAPFGILGNSFGGAVAVQAMAVEPRLCCGVVESTFANLDEIVFDYQRRMLHIPFRFVAQEALSRACEIAGFEADEACPERSAARVVCPVLLIHGDADERIDISNGRRIFAALAAPDKQWLSIHGAGHEGLARAGGERYREARLQFFRYWCKDSERRSAEGSLAEKTASLP